jgi:hypothetical protein
VHRREHHPRALLAQDAKVIDEYIVFSRPQSFKVQHPGEQVDYPQFASHYCVSRSLSASLWLAADTGRIKPRM